MENKKRIAAIGFALIVIVGGLMFMFYSKDGGLGRQNSQSMKDDIKGLLVSDEKLAEAPFGQVLSAEISQEEFIWEYSLCLLGDLPEPADRAWQNIKKKTYVEGFAKNEGIYPDEEEIKSFVSVTRETVENGGADSEKLMKKLLDGLGMTEERYWDFYEKYEAGYQMVADKIEKLADEKGYKLPSGESITAKIYDQAYYDKFAGGER